MSLLTTSSYPRAASIFHWAVAVPVMGSIDAILQAECAPKSEIQYWMYYHESLDVLTTLILVPRMAYRVLNR